MPWLINEDAALKLQLQGITVTDGTAPPEGRMVKVRFINPEDELVKFRPPMILISMPTISLAFDRMGAGGLSMVEGTFLTQLPYAPEGQPNWWSDTADSYDPSLSPYYADVQPYDLDYQITVIARIGRQHLMPIMAALEQPTMLGRNATLTIPQDGTYRRMTRMGGPARQFYSYKDGPLQKKLFTATYMVRVASEFVPPARANPAGTYGPATDLSIDLAYGQAIANTDLSPYYNEEDLIPGEIATSFGILGIRQDVAWNTQSRD